MNMIKILFSAIFFSFSFLLAAQTPAKPVTEDKSSSVTQIPKIKYPPRADFNMRGLGEAVKEKNDELLQKYKKMKGIEWASISMTYLIWSEHPYIEEAARIDRRWFKKLGDIMAAVSKCRTEMEVASERNLVERFDKAKAAYENLIKNFLATIKKPVTLSDKDVESRTRKR